MKAPNPTAQSRVPYRRVGLDRRRTTPLASYVSIAAFVLAFLAPALVHADVTYDLCIRLFVTIEDESGESNEVGFSSPTLGSSGWKARGIRVTAVEDQSPVDHIPGAYIHADDNGCFEVTIPGTPGVADYTVRIRPIGLLDDDNTLTVQSGSGSGDPPTYMAEFELPASGANPVILYWPDDRVLLNMYALYAYAINEGFRGNYNNEELNVFWYSSGPFSECNCAPCYDDVDNNTTDNCIDDANDQRKFVMIHEYGHSNLERSVDMDDKDFALGNQGDYDGNVPSHSARSIEYDAGAFWEGWADFVATDVWHDDIHTDDTSYGSITYPNDATADIQFDQGDCVGLVSGNYDYFNDTTNFSIAYGDTCHGADDDDACTSGECVGYNTRLDWARTLWDYHTAAGGLWPGSRRTHSQLHTDIGAADPWTDTTTYTELYDGLSGTVADRFEHAAVVNGVEY